MAADDSGSGSEANGWNFTGEAVCHQELAVVPALAGVTGTCEDGNVVDRPGT